MFNLAKLKICFLAGTLGQGGAERQLFYILKTLRQCGASPRLLCLNRREYWEEKIQGLNVPVKWVGQKKSRLIRLKHILMELRNNPPDVLQSQHFYTNLYVAAAARLLNIREVGAMRLDGINEVRDFGVVAGKLSLQAPRFIAANSQSAIHYAINKRISAGRLHLLPNVVDTEKFKPIPRGKKDHIRLLTVGRLWKQKRFDQFLSVLASVKQRSRIKIRGMIVGNGPLRQHLEQQADALKLLPDIVEFKTAVNDMTPLYQDADIFVLTSESEGTPNVLLEAMASGLPVVSTRVGGVPEIVRHEETGCLSESGDQDFMVDLLLRLINDSHLKMELGCRARKYVVANHSLDRLPVFLEDLYKTVLPSNFFDMQGCG